MAVNLDRDSDLAALRIYADPMLSPTEKQARLSEMMAPAMPVSAPEQDPEAVRVAQTATGGGEGGTTSVSDAAPSGGTLGSPPTQGAPQTATSGTAPYTPAGTDAPAPSESSQAPSSMSEAVPSEGVAPPERPGVSPADYRNSASRAALLLSQKPAGPAPKPQEAIQERSEVTEGPLNRQDLDEYRRLQDEAAERTVEAEYWKQQQERGAREVQVAALEAETSERARMAQIRNRTLQEAQRVRAQWDQISNEIANAEPAEEGLFVGKNFGQSLLTVLGLGLMGLGMGATGNAAQIVPTIRAMAMREADRQKRWMGLQGEKLDALGSVYERHMANLKDHELAHQATVLDITKMAELQAAKLAQETDEPRLKAELEAKSAALAAASQAEYAKLAQAFGNKVQSAVQIAYQQERGTRARQQAEAEAARVAGEREQAIEQDPEAFFARLAGQRTDDALDEDVRVATGQPEPEKAKPKAAGGKAKPAPAKADQQEAGRYAAVMDLHSQGRTDEAVARLKPNERAYLSKLYEQAKKDLGTGATDADAVDLAMQRFGAQSPAQLIPQSARERAVTTSDGRVLYATTKELAKETQGKLSKLDGTVGGLTKMVALANKYKTSGTLPPAVKSEIESLGQALMFDLSLAQEQGTVREAELPLYEKMVGSAIANYFKDPRYDLEAGVKEIRRVFNLTRQRLIQNLSPSWTGEGSGRRQVREVD